MKFIEKNYLKFKIFSRQNFEKKEKKLGKKDNFSLPKIKSNGICLSKEVLEI